MKSKSKRIVWLTSLGQTVYENLNPYWSFCEQADKPPDQIVLFHDLEIDSEKNLLISAFSTVAEGYWKKERVEFEAIPFNDENVLEFAEKARTVFNKAQSEKQQLIVDVSPTTWSYIPICLMNLAGKFRKCVSSVIYTQYAEHGARAKPYPLISRLSVCTHKLDEELRDKKDKKA